jgi:hypothetical protein
MSDVPISLVHAGSASSCPLLFIFVAGIAWLPLRWMCFWCNLLASLWSLSFPQIAFRYRVLIVVKGVPRNSLNILQSLAFCCRSHPESTQHIQKQPTHIAKPYILLQMPPRAHPESPQHIDNYPNISQSHTFCLQVPPKVHPESTQHIAIQNAPESTENSFSIQPESTPQFQTQNPG